MVHRLPFFSEPDQRLQAGQLLAHLLMAAGAGDRPVTLLAYSMGARLAFHCLLELCRSNAQARALHAHSWLQPPNALVHT